MGDSKPHSDLVAIVRRNLDHYEDQTHEDYQAACKALDGLVEQFDAVRDFLVELVEDEWSANPPYTGDFEPMNQWVGASNPASSSCGCPGPCDLPSVEEVQGILSRGTAADSIPAESGPDSSPASSSNVATNNRCDHPGCLSRVTATYLVGLGGMPAFYCADHAPASEPLCPLCGCPERGCDGQPQFCSHGFHAPRLSNQENSP